MQVALTWSVVPSFITVPPGGPTTTVGVGPLVTPELQAQRQARATADAMRPDASLGFKRPSLN
jgi:hypothetical protein